MCPLQWVEYEHGEHGARVCRRGRQRRVVVRAQVASAHPNDVRGVGGGGGGGGSGGSGA